MKALIGVDGSPNSLAAVEFAGRLLSPQRDEITVLYAAPVLSFSDAAGLDAGVQSRAHSALSQAVFDEALSRLPTKWQRRAETVEAVLIGINGSVGEAVLRKSDELAADLIVVGFRGMNRLKRFMLGSVSRAIVHSSRVPVLIVKTTTKADESVERPAGTGDQRLRVLVGHDCPKIGQKMAALLNQIEWPEFAEGWVMRVVEPMFITELPDWLQQRTRDPDVAAMAEAWRNEHRQNLEAAKHEVESLQATLPTCFSMHPPQVVEGHPAEQLLTRLAKEQFDLAVVGSRGRGNVARLLLGSTSSRLLSEAPCSVLIVR
jgi:nucleotide-binding universal stress UspA family protein